MDMRYWLIGTTLACLAVLGCDGDGRINQTSTNADTGGTDVSTGEADTDLRDATINDATINDATITDASTGDVADSDDSHDAPDAELEPGPCDELDCQSWCDPSTWGGTVPDETTEVRLTDGQAILLDCDATAKSIEIEPGGQLIASRTESSILTVYGNVVVRGHLDYGTPQDRVREDVTAEIVFAGMSDDDYQGTPSLEFGSERGPTATTPMEVLDSDVGLWVVGEGKWTAAGQLKRSWSKLTDGAGPSDAEFSAEDISGWKPGDRIALTPSAQLADAASFRQFDEATIAGVAGQTVTVDGSLEYDHAGCTDCMRRSEAINLTRNVVVRSADDEAHAHIMVAEQARVNLDSVEIRWLGPEQCGGPKRRAALYFHQQEDASTGSSVRHTTIWGGDRHFMLVERSNGIVVEDVAGYDTFGTGFGVQLDHSACGTRCTDRDSAPQDVLLREVIAAKVGVATRYEGCNRISHRMSGFDLGGYENTGCVGCVATGVGHVGTGQNVNGFMWPESGGRPQAFTFNNNVAHNNNGHGLFIWHNGSKPQTPYANNTVWSNTKNGIHWGAYGNSYVLQNFTAVDNGGASVGVKAVPRDDRPRLAGGTIDDIKILSYVLVQGTPNIIENMTFTGNSDVGVSQLDRACTSGDPTDPTDSDCLRVWLRFVNPTFPAGMTPFVFGNSINLHAVWEVRGFDSPDYPNLPANFDLYRRDNQVDGGYYHGDFDAWLVPQ